LELLFVYVIMETVPIKLLLIEDNPSDVLLIQKMLGKEGGPIYDIHVASSLSSGLTCIKTVDFVFTYGQYIPLSMNWIDNE